MRRVIIALLLSSTAAVAEPLVIEVQKSAERPSYTVTSTRTVSKTTTPLRQLPQSVVVIPRKVIDDQQSTSINEVLQNVSAVSTVRPLEEVNGTELVRGFSARQYVDGMQAYYGFSEPDSLINVEQVAVIKGPTSSLFTGGLGAGTGGMIALVSKTPKPVVAYQATVRGGSFNTFNPSFDMNQPLTDNGAILLRMTGEYSYGESWIDGVDTEKKAFFPTLQFQLNDATKLIVRGQFNNRDQTDYSGLPTGVRLRRDLLITADGHPQTTSESGGVSMGLTHTFNDVWSAALDARYLNSNFNQYSVFPFPSTPTSGSTFNIATGYLGQDVNAVTISPSVTAQFATGSVAHTALVGVDYDKTYEGGDLLLNLDPNPVDLSAPFQFPFATPNIPFTVRDDVFRTYGVYAQDQITIAERLHLLGALRWTQIQVRDTDTATGLDDATTNHRVTPKVGAAYDLNESLTTFAGYGEGFNAVLGFVGTEPVKPELSKQYEAGLKFRVQDYGLSGTWAVFDIRRTNVATADPLNPFLQVQTGEQRVRGTDMDVVWEPLDDLSLLFNYAYQQAEITKDNSANVGNTLAQVPKHSGRVAAHYGFGNGFSVGAGVTAASRQAVDTSNNFYTPGFYTVDAQAAYDFGKHYTLKLSAVNLTDQEYYEPYTFLGGALIPNQPLSGFVSLSVRY